RSRRRRKVEGNMTYGAFGQMAGDRDRPQHDAGPQPGMDPVDQAGKILLVLPAIEAGLESLEWRRRQHRQADQLIAATGIRAALRQPLAEKAEIGRAS